MKHLIVALSALALFSAPVFANETTHSGHGSSSNQEAVAEKTWTKGTIKKVNSAQSKVTVSHEAIANLDMPSMTMIFYVPDPEILAKMKEGDAKQFAFGDHQGRMIVEDVK